MIGAIIGDTIGSVWEFHNIKTTDFPLFSPGCGPTDDSVMSMAVADWLLTDPTRSQAKLEECLVRWGNKWPNPIGGYGGTFWRWLFRPEGLSADGKRHPYNSWGNGSAMRCSACGWVAESLDEALELAKRSAIITHNHPEGIKGAQATAAAIFMARRGESKEAIRNYLTTAFHYDLSQGCDDLRPDYEFDVSCQGTLPAALAAFFDSTDFESAVRLAVSLGGDSDTIACITGAIAEAFYKDIPESIMAVMRTMLPADWWNIITAVKG